VIEATLYRVIDVGLLVSVVEAMVGGMRGLHYYELIGEVVLNASRWSAWST
jgi:hypothetical protein